MKNTFKTAFAGVIAALCVVIMFLTGVIPVGTFAFPALAGILLTVMVVEFGYKWAFAVYACVSVLSFLFAADKEAALYFTAFLGFYPIVKSLIEKLKSRALQFVLKFALFNVCMVIAFYVSVFILGIPKESFEIFGVYLPLVFLAVGNVFFVLYDYCITVIAIQYINRMRDKVAAKFRF